MMEYERPVCRFIAVYEDHWEIREGTFEDMCEVVNEISGCDFNYANEKATSIPGVWMLYQDGCGDRDWSKHEVFENTFSGVFARPVEMNFVLFGFGDNYYDGQYVYDDDYRDVYWDYRSLTDVEIAQCLRLLERVALPERKVFLGGSQSCTALPEAVQSSLNCWMRRHMAFLIGDSEGADQLMQKYLHEKGYEKVTVFVNGGDKVRCNEGGWPVHHCPSSAQTDSCELYSARDIRMAEMADEAYMLWDGESLGTHENIVRMRQLGKEVTVCREQAGWCWEERCTDTYSSINDEKLQDELKRYSVEESRVIRAAVRRCPEAAKELHLKKDEAFTLERLLPNVKPDPDSPLYQPFLSFTDALAVIGDEMVSRDPALPKPRYVLEKWTSKGEFNLTFFRNRDELYDLDPPQDDYHMEQTARFEMEGDEVVSFRLIKHEKEKR